MVYRPLLGLNFGFNSLSVKDGKIRLTALETVLFASKLTHQNHNQSVIGIVCSYLRLFQEFLISLGGRGKDL